MNAINLKLSLFLFALFFVTSAFTQETNEDSKKDNGEQKKSYSEAEFLDAVNKEVENRLAKYRNKNLVKLTKELMKKERSLELRELEIQKREESLRESEGDLTKKLKEFQQKGKRLLGCLDQQDKNQSKRVRHMVDAISGMRPQNAADVLSVQDVDISVKILGELPPEKVSKIFNSMDKEISARLQKQYMNMKR